jgi:hypothetical protein
MRTFLFSLLVSWPLFAQEAPKQSILGAEKPIQAGELVLLSISPPPTTPGLVASAYEWAVFDGLSPKRFAEDAQGKVFFGAGKRAKKFLVVVAATHLLEADKDGKKTFKAKTALLHATVTVEDDEPAPPPGPGPVTPPQPSPPAPAPAPTPGPDPTFADGKFGLAKFSYDAAKKVPAEGKAKAPALAASFKATATKIRAGQLKGVKAILEATAKSNNDALGDGVQSWEGWSDEFQNKLIALYEGGKFSSDLDWSVAFEETASGLEKVK